MKDTKLIEILKTFSKEEFKNLEKFISSPYHRKRDLDNLFRVLKPFHPSFDGVKLTNEFVFEKLYPGKKFGDSKSDSLLKTLTSEMFFLCKDFLIQIELNENITIKKYFLMNQLRKRKLYKEFVKELPEVNKRFEIPGGEVVDLLGKYYLFNPLVEYYIDVNDFKNGYEMIIRQNEFLAVAAITKGLRFTDQKKAAEQGYNLKTRNSLGQSFIRYLDVDSLIEELKLNKDMFVPYIEMSYLVHEMLIKKHDIKYFFKVKELLLNYADIFTMSEKYVYYSILANYGYLVFTDPEDRKYKKEIVGVYDTMLKTGVYKYSEKDYFQIGLFRTMLIQARVSKEYKWMKDLIDNYSDELHPDYRENMKYYSMGQYYFTIGEFGKALENLILVKSDYFLNKKDIKNLMFRIYYSLGHYEEAYSVLDTLKHYLASTKDLSEKIADRSKKFVAFATELLRLKTSNQRDRAGYLLKKINSAIEVESQEWLIEKFEEMT